MKTDSRGMPLKTEFRSATEVILEVLGPPDSSRRQMCRVFRRDDRPQFPTGVRARVITVVPSRWVRDQRAAGSTVRMMSGGEPPCA